MKPSRTKQKSTSCRSSLPSLHPNNINSFKLSYLPLRVGVHHHKECSSDRSRRRRRRRRRKEGGRKERSALAAELWMRSMMFSMPTELTPLRAKLEEGVNFVTVKTVGFWEEFADFLGRSSVAELAIGIVIGTAFQVMINSLLSDMLLPPTLGVIMGSNFVNLFYLLKSGRNGPNYATVSDALNDGAITINYGRFLQLLVSFLSVVVMLFILVKIMQEVHNHVSWRRKWQECPFCCTRISSRAVRCPFCTSHIPPAAPQASQMSTYGLDPDSGSDSDTPPVTRSRTSQGSGVPAHAYRQVSMQAQRKGKQMPAAPIPDFETYTHSADPIGLGAPIGH